MPVYACHRLLKKIYMSGFTFSNYTCALFATSKDICILKVSVMQKLKSHFMILKPKLNVNLLIYVDNTFIKIQ